MKKNLLYVAAMAAMAITTTACSDAVEEGVAPEAGADVVTISVSGESADSRVSYGEDWATSWDVTDDLLVVGTTEDDPSTTSLNMFTCTEANGSEAKFEGRGLINLNLIYPYSVMDGRRGDSYDFDLDLTTQRAGSKHTYMVSDGVISEEELSAGSASTNMKHLGAAMTLDMQFTGYPNCTLESLEVSGLCSRGVLDAGRRYGHVDQFTDLTKSTITISDVNEVISGALDEDDVQVRFNIFPTTVAANEKVTVRAYLRGTDGSVTVLTKDIEAGSEDVVFGRAQHHTLRCGFDSETVVSNSGLWTDHRASDLVSTDDPYKKEISSAAQLAYLAYAVNDNGSSYNDMTVTLTADIDLSGHEWVAIGKATADNQFKGTFDGNGHTISGLYIDEDATYQGLFGYINGATIKNLSVSGYVKGSGYVGGVVGFVPHVYNGSSSSITNCSFSGSVISSESVGVGGIVGSIQSSNCVVTNCSHSGNVSGLSSNNYVYAGGVVGNLSDGSSVNNSYHSGSVFGKGPNSETICVGGVVGGNNGSVNGCYCSGSVGREGGDSWSRVGGIVGQNEDTMGSVRNCYWDSDDFTGEAVGAGSTSVTNTSGKSKAYMQGTSADEDTTNTRSFVQLLIDGASSYNTIGTPPSTKACGWRAVPRDYPTFESSTEPESGSIG